MILKFKDLICPALLHLMNRFQLLIKFILSVVAIHYAEYILDHAQQALLHPNILASLSDVVLLFLELLSVHIRVYNY